MEGFPPLQVTQVTQLTLEERMARMEVNAEETNKKMARMEVDAKETNKKIEKLLLPFCERELLILGGEILKWVVKKRGISTDVNESHQAEQQHGTFSRHCGS